MDNYAERNGLKSRKDTGNSGKNKRDKKNKHHSDRGVNCADYADRGRNNPDWYAANPQLLRDSASLSFNNPLGTVLPHENLGITAGTNESIPGIMKLSYMPNFGISKDGTSALNTAARRLYSYCRYANSGARNYDAPDFALFILGVVEAFVYWAWMVRIYGTMQYYQFKNRYTPKALVTAMGANYEDLANHLADFRAYINLYAAKLSCVCIPGDLTYIQRAMWCVTHVWKDADNDKAQMYFLNPDSFFKYNEFGESGGALEPISVPTDATLDVIRSTGNQLIDALVESEDIGIMSGDVLKAWGADKILKIAPISENFTIAPEFSEEVCMQIMNATCWHVDFDQASITQDPDDNILLYDPQVKSDSLMKEYPTAIVLNMRGGVEPSDVMVATRLTSMVDMRASDTIGLFTCGTELITKMTVYYYHYDVNDQELYLRMDHFQSNMVMDMSNPEALMNCIGYMCKVSQFDYHPIVYLMYRTPDNNTGYAGIFGDLDNYTILDRITLEKMNQTAVLSLLNSPGMGSLSIK